MNIFIYKWEYYNGFIYGSSLSIHIKVSGFNPWSHVPCSTGTLSLLDLHGGNTILVNKVPSITHSVIIQFTTENNLPMVGWVSIDNYTTNGTEYYCHCLNINTYDCQDDIPPLHIISFDIEAYSSLGSFPDPHLPENCIICIGTVSNIHGPRTFIGDECRLIEEFTRYILSANILIGYNIYRFDWMYIRRRMAIYGISIHGRYGSNTCKWKDSKFNNIVYPELNGILTLDMYPYMMKTFKIRDYKLNTVAEHFGCGNKMIFSVEQLWSDFSIGKMTDIIKYCEQDCSLVLSLVTKSSFISNIFALSNVTRTGTEQLLVYGQQHRVKNVLISECIKSGYYANFKESPETYSKYQGATVIDPIVGMKEHCGCMDFASLYPSIILSHNICYSTYDESSNTFTTNRIGIIPALIRRLITERNNTRHLPAYNNAIKIFSNSIYGSFGAKGSLYMYAAASLITRVGRQSLTIAIDHLNNKGYTVVYGDTDSCIYTTGVEMTDNEHKQIAHEVSVLFPDDMNMKYEAKYRRFLVLGKKMYITIDYNNNIKYKGVMAVRRDFCKFNEMMYREITGRVIRNELFRDFCRQQIKDIEKNTDDMFYIKKTYNGPYKIENHPMEVLNRRYGNLSTGDVVYVKVCSGTTLGDRLRLADSNERIDYMWYLRSLVPQIDTVMETSGKVFRLKYNISLYKSNTDL